MSETPCPRLGKWIGGCKWRPRYDVVGAQKFDIEPMVFMTSREPIPRPSPGRQTYIGDVCETCGKMLFKRKAAP